MVGTTELLTFTDVADLMICFIWNYRKINTFS
jgi:hypothetical protein